MPAERKRSRKSKNRESKNDESKNRESPNHESKDQEGRRSPSPSVKKRKFVTPRGARSRSRVSAMVTSAKDIQINRQPTKVKHNRGKASGIGNKFKQQKLKAWKPALEPGIASPTLFVIAIICLPIGLAIQTYCGNLHEQTIPYTDCTSNATDANNSNTTVTCAQEIGDRHHNDDGPPNTCFCRVPFTLTKDLKGQILMYYELTKFYQNHRQYVKSIDDSQIFGGSDDSDSTSVKNCKRLYKNKDEKIYWPCGANARSMFQDDIKLFQNDSTVVELTRTGIAWPSDKNMRFKNPDEWNSSSFRETHVSPENWVRDAWNLDPTDEDNNGLQNEDLIVWMRVAAFPTFRKLYRILQDRTLPKGDYYLDIEYSFPVTQFGGTKSIVLSNTSFLGARNFLFGICFLAVGGACLFMGLFFLVVHCIIKRAH